LNARLFLSFVASHVLWAHGEPTITQTQWRGFDAFTLGDGRSEAVVVPALGGRVMSYGMKGGVNFIWNGAPGNERAENAQFWGGDKTFIGPHTLWGFYRTPWPPPLPDRTAHSVEKLDGARLRTTSPTWEPHGTKIVREYAWENEALVITHTLTPAQGSHALGAVWTVTQIVPTDTVYVPLNPQSPYREGVYWFGWSKQRGAEAGAKVVSPSLLELHPTTGTIYKFGAHPTRPALVAVKDGVAFLQTADPQEGQYPEGADGAGLNVEIYHHDTSGPGEYTELEHLSPLRRLDAGATLTTRWSLHEVAKDGRREACEKLLEGK
jgi:hypothetical protein